MKKCIEALSTFETKLFVYKFDRILFNKVVMGKKAYVFQYFYRTRAEVAKPNGYFVVWNDRYSNISIIFALNIIEQLNIKDVRLCIREKIP